MTIDEYITQFPKETQQRLQVIRAAVQQLAPEAVESYSYGLIGWKYHGKPLIYTGGFAHHIGVYATPNTHTPHLPKISPRTSREKARSSSRLISHCHCR